MTSAPFDFRATWPLSWRVAEATADTDAGAVVTLNTGRVLLPDGDATRATAVILAQRPDAPAARAEMIKKGARNIFANAKLKPLPALLPGSRREQFREAAPGGPRMGEVTTLEHGDLVYFLVLNAPAPAYPKFKDDYAALVKAFKAGASGD